MSARPPRPPAALAPPTVSTSLPHASCTRQPRNSSTRRQDPFSSTRGSAGRRAGNWCAAPSTTTSYTALLDAATPGEAEKPARSTIEGYRSALQALWLLDPVPGWAPTLNPLKRVSQAPKHHLADPALAASLLGVGVDALLRGRDAGPPALRDGDLAGRLFESLVVLSLRTYAQAAEARVAHFRTRNGDHEVDMIVGRADGRVLAIEVKIAPSVSDDDVRHLRWLGERYGDDLLDAVVITAGRDAYRRRDGVAVIPAALLGP